MISFRVHSNTKSSKRPASIDRSVGADGYPAYARAVVCEFQAIVEREADCDYDALRHALHLAKDRNFVITLVNLRRAYNDVVYASAQCAYVSR